MFVAEHDPHISKVELQESQRGSVETLCTPTGEGRTGLYNGTLLMLHVNPAYYQCSLEMCGLTNIVLIFADRLYCS